MYQMSVGFCPLLNWDSDYDIAVQSRLCHDMFSRWIPLTLTMVAGLSVLTLLLIHAVQEPITQIMHTGCVLWNQKDKGGRKKKSALTFIALQSLVVTRLEKAAGRRCRERVGAETQRERAPTICQLLHLSPQPFDEAAQGYEANQTPWQPLPQQACPLDFPKGFCCTKSFCVRHLSVYS